MIQPVKIIPALKSYIWGGTKLKSEFNIKTDADTVAEAWSLSVHPDGTSMLENGMNLEEYLKENPSYMGKNAEKFEKFPLLIKLIDACDNLSVQVHPIMHYRLRVNTARPKCGMLQTANRVHLYITDLTAM